MLLALVPIPSKLLLSLMCCYFCTLSFFSAGHNRTPYYRIEAFALVEQALLQEHFASKISILSFYNLVKSLAQKSVFGIRGVVGFVPGGKVL